MPSNLFQQLNGNISQQNVGGLQGILSRFGGSMPSMLSTFNEFRSMTKGNPDRMIQWLLNTGCVNQDALSQATQIADEIHKLSGR